MQVEDPGFSSLVYILPGTTEDKFDFVTTSGGCCKFCFQNPYSSTKQVVYFNIEVSPNRIYPFDQPRTVIRRPHLPSHQWKFSSHQPRRTTYLRLQRGAGRPKTWAQK